ncbi:UNVERIFIED_CONTAM: hypothetical protein H355_013117 [Colinus virginianus]|nr:hypothetical protein H355_013117 [Colinus virginianus]
MSVATGGSEAAAAAGGGGGGGRVFFQSPRGGGGSGREDAVSAAVQVQQRRHQQGKVTVKYDRKELRKRLVLEEWIVEQLGQLYGCQGQENMGSWVDEPGEVKIRVYLDAGKMKKGKATDGKQWKETHSDECLRFEFRSTCQMEQLILEPCCDKSLVINTSEKWSFLKNVVVMVIEMYPELRDPSKGGVGNSDLRNISDVLAMQMEKCTDKVLKKSEEEMPDVEIDIDDLLDAANEEERALKLQETLVDCYKPTEGIYKI